ncbi:response regulator [Flectobacillus major]|uniref:response regulator n=1 Tax=Flectobacillus major TaxID=103 RepID=UPI00047E482C|nr:response regulator transcription factor [Flectobacillus major]
MINDEFYKPIKVMIADDHKLFSDGLKMILSADHSIEIVAQIHHSKDILSAIQQYIPHLVILDFNMPHFSGLEIMKLLSENTILVNVLVLSSYADEQQIDKFRQFGAKGYFHKTVESAELIEAIKRIYRGETWIVQKSIKVEGVEEDSFMKMFKLTNREMKIIQLIKHGKSSADIANDLFLSNHTVNTHKRNIYLKLSINNERELLKFIKDNGM